MNSANAALSELLEAVEGIDVGESAKGRFIALIREIGAAHGHGSFKRQSRVDFARELLKLRVSRPTIRDRLIAMYGVSRPQAYRIIASALALDHAWLRNETEGRSNGRVNSGRSNHD